MVLYLTVAPHDIAFQWFLKMLWKFCKTIWSQHEYKHNISCHMCLDWIWKRCLYFIHPNVAKSESYTKMCRSRWCGSFHGITDVMAFKNSGQIKILTDLISPTCHPAILVETTRKRLVLPPSLWPIIDVCSVRPKRNSWYGNIFKATDMGALHNLHDRSRLQPGKARNNSGLSQMLDNISVPHLICCMRIHFTITKSTE